MLIFLKNHSPNSILVEYLDLLLGDWYYFLAESKNQSLEVIQTQSHCKFLALALVLVEQPVRYLDHQISFEYFGLEHLEHLFVEDRPNSLPDCFVHDKFHRALVLSGFFFLKIASTFLNSSFFPKPIKRRIAI